MTEQELQSVINAVLSSIKTNSRSIGQLTGVQTLSDSDCFEVAGGRKIAYSVLRDLIFAAANTKLENMQTDIANSVLQSVSFDAKSSTATLTIKQKGYDAITVSVPKATDSQSGIMTAADKDKLDNTYSKQEIDALTAEMGKELKGMIDNVGVKFGTYAEALEAVLASNSVFEWLLVDKVDSGELIKPLWHVNGSLIDAAGAVVSLATLTAPVFSRDSGDVYVGTTVTITCPSGSTLYYSVNGIAATSTSDVKITINEASVVKAYLKSGNAVSDIVAKSYGIAVDHKFQFKIKLTGDNSTEYVPVVASGAPKYTMTVDWGDGSTPSEYTNKYFNNKGCGHTYSGTAGDEFVITLRGTAIPSLQFGRDESTNQSALVAILENTLECKTYFSVNGCASLNYLSADAFSNSIDNGLSFARCSSLTSFEDGFFTNLISGGTIETCYSMFMNTPVTITASQMSELKSRLSQCAVFEKMFYGTNNYIDIPNDFFDDVKVKITSVYAFTHTSGEKVTGDAKALYDALQSKVSSNVSTAYAFTGSGLSNRNQVPGAWGGSGS